MNFEIIVTSTFEKNFRKLDSKTQRSIIELILKLKEDPFIGKKLKGELEGLYSLRYGNYRVIYRVDDDRKIIILYTVSHRKKAYT